MNKAMSNVTVIYDDFTKNNSSVTEISFELIDDVILTLKQNDDVVNITMNDSDTGEVELTGDLDLEILNNLIRSLNIFKNQIVSLPPTPEPTTGN